MLSLTRSIAPDGDSFRVKLELIQVFPSPRETGIVNYGALFRFRTSALLRKRCEAFLTVLGITIGIAAVNLCCGHW